VRNGSTFFRLLLCVGWLVLLVVSVKAVSAMGVDAAGQTFFNDFSHPWRAQFNTDFGLHLLLVAAWMLWRSRSLVAGLLAGLLAIGLGGLFTLVFLLVVSTQEKGDLRKVLLGRHADSGA